MEDTDGNAVTSQNENFLCKLIIEGITCWKVLCSNCRKQIGAYKKITSLPDTVCENCELGKEKFVICKYCLAKVPLDNTQKHFHEITKVSHFKVLCRIDEQGNLVIP